MSKFLQGQVVNLKRWTERLYSLRVEAPIEPFKAGQFGKLALDIDGQMVFRLYSFVNAPNERPLEFYFIVLANGPLTQRLIKLNFGDPIFVAPRAAGFLTLSELPEAKNLWLLSTGTAIGPFLSILKTGEPWRRFSSIVLVHAVRNAEELTYQDQIRRLLDEHPVQLKMVPFVSREDTSFAIKGRVPEAIKDGRLEAKAGVELSAERSQVMICGNPDMVRDTSLMLEERGLKKNRRKAPGHITIENYW
ncbi:MAG: ferredoxin--NADP reductase [Pseudomonadota bacterium]|mgnify:CR=1 FL=1